MDIFNIDGDIRKLKSANFQNIAIIWPILPWFDETFLLQNWGNTNYECVERFIEVKIVLKQKVYNGYIFYIDGDHQK